MSGFLVLILGLLCFFVCGCGEKEEEPVDIDRMVMSQEEEAPEWSPPIHIQEKLLTSDLYPQEIIVPEGSEMPPQGSGAEFLK